MKRLLIGLWVVLFLLSSCMKEEIVPEKIAKRFGGERSLVLPISEGSISLKDIFDKTLAEDGSDSLILFEGDTVSVFYVSDSVFKFTADDYLSLPQQNIELDVFNLGIRQVDNFSAERIVTLAQLVNNMGEPQKSTLTAANGQSAPFPAIPEQDLGEFDFEPVSSIDSVVMAAGEMSITIENNFQVAINKATFEVVNRFGLVVGVFIFDTPILPGATAVKTSDLAGKIITDELSFEIIDYQMSGSITPVPIDLDDDIILTFGVENGEVEGGRAILPDQIFDQGSNNYDVSLGNSIEELYFFELKKGSIVFTINTFIEEDVNLVVTLPNTFEANGDLFERTIFIDKQFAVNQTPFEDSLDLTGTKTWLVDGEFPVDYRLSLVSSGQMVEFNFPDSIQNSSFIQQRGIVIESARGYFGQDTINFGPEITDIDFDLEIDGNISLTNPTFELFYSNRSRVPLDIDVDVKAKFDDKPDVDISIQDELAIPEDFESEAAVFDTIKYNVQNTPELVDLLSIPPPSQLIFQGSGFMNPDGQSGDTNFIHNHDVQVGVLIKLPLEFNASNVVLTDTFNFEINFSEEGSETEIDIEASLLMKLKNTFPLEVDLSFYFIDTISGIHYDTIDFNLPAAPVDDMGVAIESQAQEVMRDISMTKEMHDNFENFVNGMIMEARISSTPDGNGDSQDVKVLTTSRIDFHIGFDGVIKVVQVN